MWYVWAGWFIRCVSGLYLSICISLQCSYTFAGLLLVREALTGAHSTSKLLPPLPLILGREKELRFGLSSKLFFNVRRAFSPTHPRALNRAHCLRTYKTNIPGTAISIPQSFDACMRHSHVSVYRLAIMHRASPIELRMQYLWYGNTCTTSLYKCWKVAMPLLNQLSYYSNRDVRLPLFNRIRPYSVRTYMPHIE